MTKNKPKIFLNNWGEGMHKSAYLGFEKIQGIDAETKIGVARVKLRLKKASGSVITGEPKWMVKSPKEGSNTICWLQDDDGKIYKQTGGSGTSWAVVSGNTVGNGNGLQYFKDYIIDFRGNALNTYGPLSGTPSWDNSSLGGAAMPGSDHPSIVSQNGKLYFGAKHYVMSIEEVDGKTFDPTDSSTYIIKNTEVDPALDLAEGDDVIKISELGSRLMISTNNDRTNKSNIFPWDTTSKSFELPIKLGSEDIHTSIVKGGKMFVIAGKNASIYITDGVNINKLSGIPETYSDIGVTNSVTVWADAIMSFQDRIYFATSYKNLNDIKALIWSFSPNQENIDLNIAHTLSSGNTGSGNTDIDIPSLLAFSDTLFLVGWEESLSDIGVDVLDTTQRYTSYKANIVSKFERVGTVKNKVTLVDGIATFSKSLATGEGAKIYYREEKNASWKLHQTLTGSKDAFILNDIPSVYNIQFKIELTTPSGSESTPELLDIIWY